MTINKIELFCTIITAIVTSIGVIIALKTYRESLKQIKIQNTFKILEFAKQNITENYIVKFIKLLDANNPIVHKENEFVFENGNVMYVETMFSEGGCGNGEIENIVIVLNHISKKLLKNELDEDMIWFEYGQIMINCYKWVKIQYNDFLKTHENKENIFFYYLYNYMIKNEEKMLFKPSKVYWHCE